MTVSEFIKELQKYDGNIPIYRSCPVQGDCENLENFEARDIDFDDRYPAVVIF